MNSTIDISGIGKTLALLALVGCASANVTSEVPKARALQIHECRIRSLTPLVGADLAKQIVDDFVLHEGFLGDVILRAGVGPKEFIELRRSWAQCVPPLDLTE
jgi:hypothetical protein